MARTYENRGAGWGSRCFVALDQSVVFPTFPGSSQRASGFGIDVHECFCQYVGESQEGHGDRCHADVLGFERFGVDLDSYRGDDLSGTDGGSQSFGRFLAHFNRHVHGDVRGAFGIVYQTENQYIRPGNSAMGIGAYGFCGRSVLLFLLFAGREDFVLFGFCSQQYSVYDYRNFYHGGVCQANQCLRCFYRGRERGF